MQIGIVGTGNVGGALGRRFAEVGHSVTFGSRHPDSPDAQELARVPGARVASPKEAAQSSDAALTTASAEMKWMNGWSAAATFEGEFSNVTRSYAGKGIVRYAW